MNTKSILWAVAGACFAVACTDANTTAPKTTTPPAQVAETPVTAPVPTYDSATLLRFITTPDAANALDPLAAARELLKQDGAEKVQELSNNYWAGTGVDRDRRIATLLAIAASEANPQAWSSLRAGIGYLNGTGVDVDADKAIALLTTPAMAENAGAVYFASRAYRAKGDVTNADAFLKKAADMGHEAAKADLAGTP
jgi:TPR repeat protein